jgi:UDP-N-acetylmuramyl pentapeptide phosphotransferase/UDP-N-acetylglucosamine-1-phosphate transferase
MIYVVISLILLASLFFYKYIALKYDILDWPNSRSSHNKPTIRGGGIIFPIAGILATFLFDINYPFFLSGLVLVAIISFIDDVKSISFRLRLLVQLAGAALLLFDVQGLNDYWLVLALFFILTSGWLNAYNFMDGINGITSLYALTTLIAFLIINNFVFFVNEAFIIVFIISVALFSFFNVRRKALMFAGDIGSISLAFVLAFLMISLLSITGHWFFILFFLVYGVDSILTIIERLFKGENIFEAHRSHLYQILANETKAGHLKVSFAYSGIQLLISALVILGYLKEWPGWTYFTIATFVGLSYILIKMKMKRK